MLKYVLFMVLAFPIARCAEMPSTPLSTTGDAEHGAEIFAHGEDDSPPCSTCHHTQPGQTGFTFGPNLAGIGERAATREEGMSAEDYLRQSILEPHVYVVSGFRDTMYGNYGDYFSDQDVEDLIAYLMTLDP